MTLVYRWQTYFLYDCCYCKSWILLRFFFFFVVVCFFLSLFVSLRVIIFCSSFISFVPSSSCVNCLLQLPFPLPHGDGLVGGVGRVGGEGVGVGGVGGGGQPQMEPYKFCSNAHRS